MEQRVVIGMREVEIVEGLRKKDMKALHAAIDQYGDLIYKVVHGVLDTSHSKVLVDECVDDILLIIWYNIDSYDEKRGKFRNWLISIAKFKAIDLRERVIKYIDYKNFSRIYMKREQAQIKQKKRRKKLLSFN